MSASPATLAASAALSARVRTTLPSARRSVWTGGTPAREYVSTYSRNVGSNSIPCVPGSDAIRVRPFPSIPIRTRGRPSGPSIAPLQYSTFCFSSTP